MADYPSLVKSWQWNVNQLLKPTGVANTDAQNLMWALYQSLITFATNHWTVVSSANFSSASSLVWNSNGNAHSWIVLQQTGILSTFQLLITLTGTSNWNITVYYSPVTGFSGGNSTTDPAIPADAVQLINNAAWGVCTTDVQYKLHAMQSSDGSITRVLICTYLNSNSGGVTTGFLSLELPQNPVTGWTNPVHGMWLGSSSTTQMLTLGNLYQTASGNGRATSNFTLFWTGENTNGSLITSLVSAPNDLNQEWLFEPIGLFSNTTGSRGRHGALYDIWWGTWNTSFTGFANGAPYQGASANAFAQFGCVIFPWNGTTPQAS